MKIELKKNYCYKYFINKKSWGAFRININSDRGIYVKPIFFTDGGNLPLKHSFDYTNLYDSDALEFIERIDEKGMTPISLKEFERINMMFVKQMSGGIPRETGHSSIISDRNVVKLYILKRNDFIFSKINLTPWVSSIYWKYFIFLYYIFMENTTALATQNAELALISPDVAAYLAEIDKLNVKRSGIMTPTIACMRSLKDSEDYGIPLGNYFSKKKGENDKYVFTNRGREMKLIILRIASQYSYFDGISNTMVMQTTEFGPGVGDTLVCTDEDKNIVFEGNSKDFKAWALKNHPKHDANPQYPSSMFKYSTILYVADINETEVGTPKGVYKISLSTTNNDYLWKYQNSCSGFPIRYLTTFTPEAMDKGSNRWYVSKMEIDEEVPADVLVQMIKLKQELDGYLNFAVQNLKAPKVDDVEMDEIPDEIVEVHDVTEVPTVAEVREVVQPVSTMPAPAAPVPPVVPQIVDAKTTEQALKDAEDVFG